MPTLYSIALSDRKMQTVKTLCTAGPSTVGKEQVGKSSPGFQRSGHKCRECENRGSVTIEVRTVTAQAWGRGRHGFWVLLTIHSSPSASPAMSWYQTETHNLDIIR